MSKPTCRELVDRHNWLDAVELKARVERVLALHRRVDAPGGSFCVECEGSGWPCPTVCLLDGEEQ